MGRNLLLLNFNQGGKWGQLQVWVRVHLGGERRIDIARGYGYKDGSAITQMLKRLQKEARSKPAFARRMARLETEINETVSRVKDVTPFSTMKAKQIRTILAALACLIFTATALRAQVPQIINYQGRVAVDGTNFSGTGEFEFALVSGSGVTTYWSNDGTSIAGSQPTSAVSLTVSSGLYSVGLGDTTITNMTAVPYNVFGNSAVFLRVWFNDGTHGWQLLAPDQRIAAVGYAMVANGVVNGSVTSAMIVPGAVGSSQIANDAVGSSQIANNAVGTAQLAGGAVTSAQIASGAVGTAQLAASAVSFTNRVPRNVVVNAAGGPGDVTMGTPPASTILTGTNTQDEAIPGLNSVTLTTVGGPVIAMLVPLQNNSGGCYVGIAPASSKTDTAYYTLYRDSASTGRTAIIVENNPQVWNLTAPAAITFIDQPSAGSHTYQLDVHTQGNGGQWIMSGCELVVFEL
jgi:hypothetical protein